LAKKSPKNHTRLQHCYAPALLRNRESVTEHSNGTETAHSYNGINRLTDITDVTSTLVNK